MRVGNGMCVGDGMRIGNARASGDPAMPLHKARAARPPCPRGQDAMKREHGDQPVAASVPAGPRPVVEEVSDATYAASVPAGPRPVVEEVSDATYAASGLAGTSRTRIPLRGSEPHTIGAVAPARGLENRAPGLRIRPPAV